MGGILSLLILGLIAGILAKSIFSGKAPSGWIATIILGIIGSYVGGYLGSLIFGISITKFSLGSILIATLGALVVLWIYNKVKK